MQSGIPKQRFDVDGPAQYKEMRKEMPEVYDDVIGPVFLPCRDKSELTLKKQKLW